MKLQVLGCSGGIGEGLHTTTYAVDQDILIDAGTGIIALESSALVQIDHIFVTHSHLDHVAGIPLLADTTGQARQQPITVYGIRETLQALHQHLFNDLLWPDFTRIPPDRPFLRFQPVAIGETLTLSQGRRITPIPAQHTVPAVGYWLDSGKHSLVYSGDTKGCPEFWKTVGDISNLSHLIIENSFRNREIELARISQHLCPQLLEIELKHLKHPAEIWITHLKPSEIETIVAELAQISSPAPLKPLWQGQTIEF